MKSKWLGLCVVCRKDLYRDPSRHYISRSHLERVAASDRRRERDRLRAEDEALREANRREREEREARYAD